LPRAAQSPPVYALAIAPEKRNDEVKLSSALAKLLEDPTLAWEQHGDTHEVILWGQGEIHLQVALDRLRRKYNLPMTTRRKWLTRNHPQTCFSIHALQASKRWTRAVWNI